MLFIFEGIDKKLLIMLVIRSYGVMVITEDSDSSNPGSNPGMIFLYINKYIENSNFNFYTLKFHLYKFKLF